ncbi:MAG: iron-sulfur cluster-binding domain-containing protein [Saccharofermentans sp.]|nr:iron-sulfur cluster-binding domain-containing protein [Saccharofermentans sp.]
MDNKEYLSTGSVEDFKNLIPKRRAVIEKASDKLPEYEFNANIVAAQLHPKVQHVVVTEIKELKDAKCYTLAPDKEKGTDRLAYFRAGQYISLSLKIGDSVLTRPYSLCSSPSEALNGIYRIVVKSMKDGFASEYINSNFAVGTKIDISAPSGFFYYEPIRDVKSVVGIAGGSGIAPFMSFASAIADGTEDFDLTLLYGSRTEADIIFKDELDKICESCDRVRVIYVLSDEEKSGYEHGFITSDLIARYGTLIFSVFVCGSAAMYDYILGETAKLGLAKRLVRLDAYGEYKLGKKDEAFVNEFKDKLFDLTVVTNDGQTRTVPARADESILVALERAGIKAPSKCRSGECGFCRSKLASGDVYLPEATEKRRAYDRETGYIHPCCAFPRSDIRILINCAEPKVERHVKDMKKKNIRMGFIMSMIMSLAMGLLSSFLVIKFNPDMVKSTPVPMMYISNTVMSLIMGLIVYKLIPLGKLGAGLAARAGAKPPAMKFTLLNSIPMAVGNTIIISLFLSLFGVVMARMKMPADILQTVPPFAVMWLGTWAKLLLPTLLASYLLAVLLSPTVSSIVGLTDAGAEVGKASSGK